MQTKTKNKLVSKLLPDGPVNSGKRKATYIAFVLDESGSMTNGKSLTIETFNEQLRIMRANESAGGKTRVSFFKFSEVVRCLYHAESVGQAKALCPVSYRPMGGTALYDGVGAALDALEQIDTDGEDAAFLVCILTDGEERDSTKYTGKVLGSRVRRLQDTGKWTFTLMGPQRNLAQISDLLGIDSSNVAGFEPESLSSRTQVIHTESLKMGNYMTMRAMNMACAQNLYAPPEE